MAKRIVRKAKEPSVPQAPRDPQADLDWIVQDSKRALTCAIEKGREATDKLIANLQKEPGNLTYEAGWLSGKVAADIQAARAQVILNTTNFPPEGSNLPQDRVERLFQVLQHSVQRAKEDLLNNRDQGTSTSAFSNAVDAVKREVDSNWHRDWEWRIAEYEKAKAAVADGEPK